MATNKKSKHLTRSSLEAVSSFVEDFVPTDKQREVKAAFWAVAAENPDIVSNREQVTLAQAEKMSGSYKVREWWSQPGFKEWFLNADSWRQRLAYIVDIALEEALNILRDPNANPNAKVRLIEVLARLSGREPSRNKEIKWADALVGSMSEHQLKAWLASQGYVRLPPQDEGIRDAEIVQEHSSKES